MKIQEEDIETIVIVHGTFANPDSPISATSPTWWRPAKGKGQHFQETLDRLLMERGSSARCWAHINEAACEFEWSGLNSEFDRREASIRFTQYLMNLENDLKVKRYHVVAHSHGGYLACRSLLELAMGFTPKKLGAVVLLGPPLLLSRSDRVVTRFLLPQRNKILCLTGLLAIAVLWFFVARSTLGLAIVAPVFILSAMFTATSFRFVRDRYPNCRLTLITSKYDEAVIALREVIRLRRELTFRYFLRIPKFTAPTGFLWSRASVFRNLTWRSAYHLITGSAAQLVRGEGGSSVFAVAKIIGAALLLVATTPIVAIDFCLGLLAVPFKYFVKPIMDACTKRFAVKLAAEFALGQDLPLDKIVEVSALPRELEGLTDACVIPDSIQEEMLLQATNDISARVSWAHRLAAQSQIPGQQILDVFTVSSLVHAQYTRREDVISLIANAIHAASERRVGASVVTTR